VHLHSLDALRGIAALAVVAFHYPNFMMTGEALPPSFMRGDLPFYRGIALLYDKGLLAVEMFFTLSGFVFFWLYSAKIASGELKRGKFFLLRFSRLYPLHLATLLAVALLQWQYAHLHPEAPFFVVPVNDAYHFALHLFFASNWLPSFGYTFNSPVWSVSIEVLLYAIFFVFCRFVPIRAYILAIIAVFGWWFLYRYNTHLGRGVGSFFAGGLTYLLYARLVEADSRDRWCAGLLAVAAGMWAIGLYGLSKDWSFVPASLENRTRYFPVAFMFPVTVLALALLDARTDAGKRLAWLGDVSYSTYLLHFPLQLVCVMLVDAAGVGRAIFYSPWVFVTFFAVLVALAWLSYHAFERPAQDALRRLHAGMVLRPASNRINP
jgi:peptidoglycan/LPS O-acetylase OafA/YrhL